MLDDVTRYPRYRFPPAIISHAVWLYYRFALSFRDVEDLLAQRGITVSYESIRHWCEAFCLAYPHRLVTDRLGSYRAAHRVIMPPLSTTPAATPTTWPKSPTNQPGSASATCA